MSAKGQARTTTKGTVSAAVAKPLRAQYEAAEQPRGPAEVGDLAAISWRSRGDPNAQVQNGGRWSFALDRKSGFALPLGRGFWDSLFGTARSRGWELSVYEQDRMRLL